MARGLIKNVNNYFRITLVASKRLASGISASASCSTRHHHHRAPLNNNRFLSSIVHAMAHYMKIIRASLGFFAAFGGLVCGDESTGDRCKETHPIASLQDTTGDQIITCAGTPSDYSTLAAAESECRSGGYPCVGATTISRAASVCIAETQSDYTTLEGPYAELLYDADFMRPIWAVYTVTNIVENAIPAGASYRIDSSSGEVLATFDWRATARGFCNIAQSRR